MEYPTLLQKVETCIRKDLLEEALEMLHVHWKSTETIALSARLENLRRESVRGTLSDASKHLERNKVRDALLSHCRSLQDDLNNGDLPDTGTTLTATQTIEIDIKINRDFNTYSDAEQEQLMAAIKNILAINGNVTIKQKRPGSVILTLELTPEQCERLHWAIQRGELEAFAVVDSEIVERGERQSFSSENRPRQEDHVLILKQGVENWNIWREKQPGLAEVYLNNADLSGLDLSGANLIGAVLIGANLSRADLTGAHLKGVNLRGGHLIGTILNGVDLSRSSLIEADLRKAKLIETNLTKTHLSRADLLGADLTRADLMLANLSTANLSMAILTETDFIRAILIGVNLADANLIRANLTGADLTGADLTRADLTGAGLTGANLSNAVLVDTNLSSANLSEANLVSANLERANLNGADLRGVELVGSNLSGANLSQVRLGLANLSGADLTRANLKNTNLSIEQASTLKSLYNCQNLHDSLLITLQQTHPHLFEKPKDE